MSILGATGLRRSYGMRDVLRDATLAIAEGERVGLVGRNGSGKTTLARILAGEEQADAGEIVRRTELRIGYLSQAPRFEGPANAVDTVLDGLADWQRAVFGYTCMIDVSAREQGRRTWPATPLTSWLGKSFDTFAPVGPCIATADEIADPNDLLVRFWNDGQLRHNYNTNDMEHRVPALVEFATTVMTMNSGDLIACGTNHEGLGALQDGETVEIEIEKIGRMQLRVADPLQRRWERGVYMGADSTNPEAVRRHKPEHG